MVVWRSTQRAEKDAARTSTHPTSHASESLSAEVSKAKQVVPRTLPHVLNSSLQGSAIASRSREADSACAVWCLDLHTTGRGAARARHWMQRQAAGQSSADCPAPDTP